MDIFSLLFDLIWLILIICVFALKKHFVLPDSGLSSRAKIVLCVLGLATFAANIGFLGYIVYVAYNPNFEYEETSKLVKFHIYAPTYLPLGVKQASRFYTMEDAEVGGTVVRSHYDISLADMVAGKTPATTILTQIQVKPKFNIQDYVVANSDNVLPSSLERIELSNFPGQQAFKLLGGFPKIVYVLTNDNVFITLATVRGDEAELINMIESLK